MKGIPMSSPGSEAFSFPLFLLRTHPTVSIRIYNARLDRSRRRRIITLGRDVVNRIAWYHMKARIP